MTIPYSIPTHVALGEVVGSFCQVKLGHLVHCCKVRAVFQSKKDDSVTLASVMLLSPQYAPATVQIGRLRHCGGVDGACSCLTLTGASRADGDARGASGPAGRSNTAPKSQI